MCSSPVESLLVPLLVLLDQSSYNYETTTKKRQKSCETQETTCDDGLIGLSGASAASYWTTARLLSVARRFAPRLFEHDPPGTEEALAAVVLS